MNYILSLVTFAPFLGCLAILCAPKEKIRAIHGIGLASAGMSFLLSVWAYFLFDRTSADMQFVEKLAWIPSFDIHYHLGVDGISFPMVLLTTLLTLVSLIYSLGIKERVKEYFFWFLLLDVGMLGVFAALDFVLFYVFWELTLVPMYFLIGIWGGPRKEFAAIKFFLYTLFGSVFMLLGILALYFGSEPHTFNMLDLMRAHPGWTEMFQVAVFLAFYLGFAVKVPAFPFHTWLPARPGSPSEAKQVNAISPV